ncbi:enoyl-CoA hydratase/isomerase family protein [Gordonia polyisoprenivorans]|uniref:enoyl-CoA hydratase/isomerase family protein n=1 Tax=Gordonia polyisoprenivorans TaxID=84595 RepID=UPI001AD7973B|nr:enoyl-CoA hydratase/isomerase family protein [Gordonia polyisoprenivorans]QTI70945.1 enoyl-CoA hydratase/isomerase family protein [Gordonia polyisoprenivorans]
MSGASDPVLVDRIDEELMLITLNRPDRLNAINDAFIQGMHAALDQVVAAPDVRAVVLTGTGRGFCAGADLKENVDLTQQRSAELYRGQQRLADMSVRLHELPVPVVAAVPGPAVGGGFALAAACDLRVASTQAFFAAANVRIGVSGGEMGLSWMLPQALGRARATELLLTGRRLDAGEAYDWGFVNRLVEPGQGTVVDAAIELARTVAANPAFGVALTKEMLRSTGTAASLREAVLLENRTQVLAVFAGDIDRATVGFGDRDRPGA